MFDVTDPADLLALKTEVNTDPIGMGYDVNANVTTLMRLLNDPANNVGGETTGQTFTPRLMLDVLEPNDLTVGGQFTEGEQTWVRLLMESTASLDDDIEAYRAKFISVFPANAPTVTNLNARLRTLSRAEVLFGEDTVLSNQDWFAARDS